SRETVEHEAAKRRLAQLLEEGLGELRLTEPCAGFTDGRLNEVPCPRRARLGRRLAVPAFDAAALEVPFGPYRLDAAATRGGAAVLGLEVYVSNQVDRAKRAHLDESGLPWAEIDARHVLTKPPPWPALRSSLPAARCGACQQQELAA